MMIARQKLDIRKIQIGPLRSRAELDGFDSGEPEVDRNIAKCCGWQERHRVRMFCATIPGDAKAYGFYTLAVSATESKYLTWDAEHSGEDRPYIPFLYVNYVAVRREFQEQKLGTLLLINMLTRCETVARNVGVYGVALNAVNTRAADWYHDNGFRERESARMKFPLMILPVQSLFDLIKVPAT